MHSGQGIPSLADGVRDGVIVGALLAVLGTAYLLTLAPGPTWANGGTDSGELMTAAATAGVAHPSGYPTYLLLARLFQYIPVGELTVRSTLVSAVAATLSAVCVYAAVRRPPTPQPGYALIAAVAAALVCGFSAGCWSQAVIAEVYTLNAFFVGLILLFTQSACTPAPGRSLRSAWYQGIVAGLALGNHLTVALTVLGWLVAVLISTDTSLRWRRFQQSLIGMGMGLLVYLYLPLRATAHPPVNWGGADTWEGFWWLVSGSPYRQLVFGLPSNQIIERMQAWAALLLEQFGWVGIVIGFYGLLYVPLPMQRFAWLTAGLASGYSVFAIGYNSADSYAYLLPVYVIFAIWIGWGITLALTLVAHWQPRLPPLLAALLLVWTAWSAGKTAPRVDASGDRRAMDYAIRVLADAPEQALLFTASDRDTFPIWYYHYALEERADISVIVVPLLEFGWYRENLRVIYPHLRIPDERGEDWVRTVGGAQRPSRPVCCTALDSTLPFSCQSAATNKESKAIEPGCP